MTMKTGVMGYNSRDSNFVPVRVDSYTNSMQIVDYAHHEIHAGSHYFVHINKDVANGGTFAVAFTTPNTTKWLHMLFGVQVESEAEVILYESVTSWTGGSAITPLNNNRNSTSVSTITDMVFDPTMTLGSPTTLATKVFGSGKDFGGGSRSEAEIILKQNTKYYLIVTNQTSGATNETNIELDWYEHTNS